MNSCGRVNVSRLMTLIREDVTYLIKNTLFEIRDDCFKETVKNTLKSYLEKLRQRKGFDYYKIEVRTEERTDLNWIEIIFPPQNNERFVIDVSIKPNSEIEIIKLKIVI